MEYTENTIFSTATESSPTSSPDSPPEVILSPCAACKILRRRCVEKCVLAPYFPPADPVKFTIAHRVFGASNIIKLLQDLPEGQRADAVNSMVYEGNARIRDPVYGCAGAICQLQKQINQLQAEVAKAQAEIMNMQCQNTNLLEFFCRQMAIQNDQQQQQVINMQPHSPILHYQHNPPGFLLDETVLGVAWDPLWT